MLAYRTLAPKLIKSFSSNCFENVSRVHNKHVDALPTLASKVNVSKEAVDVKVMKRTLRAATTYLIPIDSFDDQD